MIHYIVKVENNTANIIREIDTDKINVDEEELIFRNLFLDELTKIYNFTAEERNLIFDEESDFGKDLFIDDITNVYLYEDLYFHINGGQVRYVIA